jgi:VIT1/CCC1 family predicted Fe2+/Mn2+ transporter
MNFPLSPSDIGLWLAVTAIILLVTSEFLTSPTTYLSDVAIDRTRLRLVALGVGAAFMFTVLLRVFQPF